MLEAEPVVGPLVATPLYKLVPALLLYPEKLVYGKQLASVEAAPLL
jgi:hypothetical protein